MNSASSMRGSVVQAPRARRWPSARVLVVAAALTVAPLGVARADAVDDAFAAGHAAAERGAWDEAVASYTRAADLLPAPSGVVEYDLGTAYAHAGRLGPATFHLRRALKTTRDREVREAARRNLGVVRRRAELRAATEQVQISPNPDWRDRLWGALGSVGFRLASIVLGLALLALLAVRTIHVTRARRRGGGLDEQRSNLTPLAIAIAVAFGVISFAHALAIRVDPEAIVLEDRADVRSGPGRHRDVAFSLQGGSSVRLVGSAPGWHQVRVVGGLEGWVPESAVGVLSDAQTPTKRRFTAAPTAEDDAVPGE